MSIGSSGSDGIPETRRASSQGRIRVGSAASKKKRIVVTDGKSPEKFRSSSPKQSDSKISKQTSGDYTVQGNFLKKNVLS